MNLAPRTGQMGASRLVAAIRNTQGATNRPRIPKYQPLTGPLLYNQQCRPASFLHESQVPANPRSQDTTRVVYNAATQFVRNKSKNHTQHQSSISTLAADRLSEESARETGGDSEPADVTTKTRSNRQLTQRQRRIWLAASLLLFLPFAGDILDAVLPGLLGVFIYIAGGIKRGIQSVRGNQKE